MGEDAADFARAIPILPSVDMSVTRSFYRDRLGFTVIGPESVNHLIVRRDEMELHFWLCDDPKLPEVSSCYIRGGQIAALHAEYRERGVEPLSDLALRPWGMVEFYIHDPQGNLLRFGHRPEAG